MAKSCSSMLLLVCLTFLVIVSSPKNEVQADALIGRYYGKDKEFITDCDEECKQFGYRRGHWESFLNVKCWCVPKSFKQHPD
ncbi:Similar to Defensin (Galleria mellonella) [Cotesia congregata]|uniref:Similar to Defensin (Galleria mellonella) n=1 Tax=Cotesia congregata TaxID=51543 RepID=A0A8J2MBE8_COTCN|nr:Similar to Defensin (Galleria mellonella) [Cotesia congregata]